jgi:exodeoxyribonuclease V beta subunit
MWLKHPEKKAHLARATRESREEAIRLAYVALTRARHRCVLYTGFLEPLAGSPLAPMLHGGTTPAGTDRLDHATATVRRCTHGEEDGPDMSGLLEPLQAWAAAAPAHPSNPALKTVLVSTCTPVRAVSAWTDPQPTATDLSVRPWSRSGLNRTWRRHSYSSIMRAAKVEGGTSRPPLSPETDEGRDVDQDVAEHTRLPEEAPGPGVPLSSFPSGATPGKVLHEVLEHADFAWARPDHPSGSRELEEMLQPLLSRHGMDKQLPTLLEGLPPVLRTPLGGPLGSLCLADLDHTDRLDELRFDLPIAGGDRHRSGTQQPMDGSSLIGALQVAPSQGVPAAYLEDLAGRRWEEMSGFLNGYIDLVTRAPCTDGVQRWFVVDYKSNRLAPGSQKSVPLRTYREERLLEEMSHHDYHLQYHLYTLAVHRYLRHRVKDYDYDRDFGGALYLFLRGMVGDQGCEDLNAPQTGIFFARPARAVVEAMDLAIGGAS